MVVLARYRATIPDWMEMLFRDLDDAPDIRQLVSATVTAEQCMRLWEHGVREFHFYTLNRPQLTTAICHILGIRPRANDLPAQARAGAGR